MNRKIFYDLVEQIQKEFPRFQIYEKENSLWMKLLYHLTFMRFWNPHFMRNYVTAMFGRVWMPRNLIGSLTGYEILRHELVHIRDARRFPIFFELSYLFLPLPIIFTARAYWEFRAYCESLRVEAETFGCVHRENVDFYVKQFTGSYYLWMCPFPNFVRKRFEGFLVKEGIILK